VFLDFAAAAEYAAAAFFTQKKMWQHMFACWYVRSVRVGAGACVGLRRGVGVVVLI